MASVTPKTTQQGSYDHLFKMVVTGDQKTGKTCLIRRFVNDSFNENYHQTIGVDFTAKTISLAENNIKLQLWDTAGQERFRNITSSYYRGAHAVIILFDLTDRKSFENIETWLNDVSSKATETCVITLVGNKSDHPERVVEKHEAEAIAEKHGMGYIETSARDDSNVNESFLQVTRKLLQTRGQNIAWWKKQGFK